MKTSPSTPRFLFLPPSTLALGIAISVLLLTTTPAWLLAAPLVRSASGVNPAAIQSAVDLFRTDLGGGTVAGADGSFGGLRREINWDGVPDNFAAPNNFPADFFNLNSPRGVVFTPIGGGAPTLQVSMDDNNPADSDPDLVRFSDIDASYAAEFQAFSAQRLFAPRGTREMDVVFFVPGTNTPATVSGFGAIFTDVEVADGTTIEFFNPSGVSVGEFSAPTAASGGLSFIGVFFTDGERIARVRITNGTTLISPGQIENVAGEDLVVMDDFIYSEPLNIDIAVTNTNDSGPGSLRAAIQQANADTSLATIGFAIPGSGVHTIAPLSALPQITNDFLTIDGYTQPGSTPNTLANGTNAVLLIELDGSNAGTLANGLHFHPSADNCLVRGLVINRFKRAGIRIDASFVGIAGNFIGTNAAGTAALGNGTSTPGEGIRVNGGIDTTGMEIGGTMPAEKNLISGNNGNGIILAGNVASTSIQGNLIGTDASGLNALGNTGNGVELRATPNGPAPFATGIGGTLASQANLIAFNGQNGVRVTFGQSPGPSNVIGVNSIFSNGLLGIDIADAGVTINDLVESDGAQNHPTLTEVTVAGGMTTITGRLDSTPFRAFRLGFFANPSPDSSGYGEGQTFIGSADVSTDDSGRATFTVTFPFALPNGHSISATALSKVSGSSTSEFSPDLAVAPPQGIIQFSNESYTLNEGGSATIFVVRAGGTSGAVSVTYTTSDGTATAGDDYTTASGVLTFADGESVKSFQVSTTQDQLTEGNETVKLTLSLPTGGAIVSGQSTTVLTILDNESAPGISINDVSMAEGNTGTTDFVFTISLSNPSTETISVAYQTAAGSATGGSDFEPAFGSRTFAPGDTTKTVTIKVMGETIPEPSETFFVDLSVAEGSASVADGRGTGNILDDDGGPTPTPGSSPSARLRNISTRLQAGSSDNQGIGGFIITGAASKRVIVRALGPSLAQFNIEGFLADPVLELHGGNGSLIATNNNWRDSQEADIKATNIPPLEDAESAIVATLPVGNYTAVVGGVNGSSGVALIEVYDLDAPGGSSRLANISTRANVQTGSNVVIGGFILGGSNDSSSVILRGIGPSLANSGLSNTLADPTLELRNSDGTLLVSNDNWADDPIQAALITSAGLSPQNAKESAIAAGLPPGFYTVILAGKSDGTGIGLVEIYQTQ